MRQGSFLDNDVLACETSGVVYVLSSLSWIVTQRILVMIIFFYQLDAQILYFNTFITFRYIFRALL